jgi:hypothetical protein
MGNALVNAGVKLSSVYGTTEFGAITYLFRNDVERKLWDWVRFSSNSKIRWVPQDDGTYECQVLVRTNHYTHTLTLTFEHFFADNFDALRISREYPGRQGLCY